MAEDIKKTVTEPTGDGEKGARKGPKLFKFRANEPMAEEVRGEMIRVGKGEIIELTAERAKAISWLVEPVE